jgi:hypothetical protein
MLGLEMEPLRWGRRTSGWGKVDVRVERRTSRMEEGVVTGKGKQRWSHRRVWTWDMKG